MTGNSIMCIETHKLYYLYYYDVENGGIRIGTG